ncbi:MAG: SDR family NAD(P)-dependent oxidoreductase, partial [Terriglobales bacterium]
MRSNLNGNKSTMVHLELLQDLTESYLKSVISEASGSLNPDFDSFAAFGELGINSFYVLKIIRKLESDFGRLPKSLLFENFTINDLAKYFVGKHERTLSAKFARELQGVNSSADINGEQVKPVPFLAVSIAPRCQSNTIALEAEPIRILEKEAYTHPELQELVQTLFNRYKKEGCVSRGTRKIAPNLFIGSARRGYFNFSRSNNIILVYGYTGPRDYVPVLIGEIYRYCTANNFQLNILGGEEIPPIGGTSFSATPFGVLQRIVHLKEFTLEGGAMRHLRYQVSKFKKSGACKTEEYRCGSSQETDTRIANIIDKWCEARTMVNPLIHEVKGEIVAGRLPAEHRLFLTYLDEVLQNVILITAMSAEENGYLMDLELYPPEMPMGGLEFAIVQIIGVLVGEGCDVLSLGGTYGCKLDSCATADPEIDKILDDLRAQNLFNDEGNLQFKNKFRPENKTIFLCRPVGSGNPDNVIDIIMMIADPDKMRTSDEGDYNLSNTHRGHTELSEELAVRRSPSSESTQASCERLVTEVDDRARTLSEFGFNPLKIPQQLVQFDLKTDSWSQLEMPAIEARMRHLHSQLQRPASVDDGVKAVFPFARFILTNSGQAAEHIFFKAWPKKGVVPQNLLFPSTILHQIDNGFTIKELPHPAVFDQNLHDPYKGNMAWDALQAQIGQDPSAISFVCIEVDDNAAGGYPVSLRHLREVKALLAEHSIPLVIDGTRVVENAQLLIEQEEECAGKSIWTIVRDIFSCADAVIGSLTKDFCVNKGGIIATNDVKLSQRLLELVHEEGSGIDLIDEKMIALSLQNRKQIEAQVLRRMEGVRRVWRAVNGHKVPILQPAGGHCIVIDVKQIPEFKEFDYPVASFVAWLYLNTGIRAGAHSVGMQKHTPINDLVRLAIPVGLTCDEIDSVIERLVHAFDRKANVPEIVMESTPQPLGSVYANYKLVKYHNVAGSLVGGTEATSSAPRTKMPAEPPSASATAPDSPMSAQVFSPRETNTVKKVSPKTDSIPGVAKTESRQTQDVAIVGMAGRYPKAKNVRELWENLVQSRDCIEDLPTDRYEGRVQHGSTARYRGGFIDDVDKFDSLFFNISPREAEMLDPQERHFLEVAWEAIEDAGYYPDILAQEDGSRNIGVFVGAVWAMYQMLGVEEKHAGNRIVPNSFLWSIANRVSYWLNLSGPSLTIDTACSSSLTAIYLACEAIRAGECSAAIVGGVNLDLHQAKLDINQAGGALSVDGVCRSFGKGANGYVAGEGIGALFLKPLDQAVHDGDNIYGVIKSAVVNHSGRTSGYTVPNPKAQTNLILSALEKANFGARSIGYIEAHGTGTELGDPIEITGLSNAFSADRVANQTCAIGSIKSNIGHLEAAAGVVGVTKVLLQMKHRQLVPSLHSAELNEFTDFRNSPFYVVQSLECWKAKEVDGVRLPLRAGISSFGAGGSNAHIILENYEPIPPADDEPAQARQLVFPLSARTEDELRDTAVLLARFLEQNRVDLSDAAYTLQIGRKAFEHRLAITAMTRGELLEKLTCFIAGRKAEGIASGQAKNAEGITRLLNRREKEEFLRLLSQGRDINRLAELWVEGLLTGWHGLQSNGSARRVSLPTYPFADKRHWAYQKSSMRHPLHVAPAMHPLVDTNESTFERQLFKKTFHERDFFIYDHMVANIPTLPGVAYLELARKAGEIAAGRKVQKIKNIVWVSPIAVHNSVPKEVFIELKPSESTVRFEVFSNDEKSKKVLHSQGTLLYTTAQEASAEPEYVDLESVRARSAKVIDGNTAYPLFKSFGLNLGPSFQVLQEVYRNGNEILGVLKLPEFRRGDLQSMVLHPSLVDGSLQAGMGAQLGAKAEEMFVPFSIGEVEILHPLKSDCFSYVTEVKEDRKGRSENARVLKSNVLILDETGKVLVKLRECIGVPLREVHKKPAQSEDLDGFSKLYYSYEWEKASLEVEKTAPTGPSSIVLFDTDENLRDLYQERLREARTNSDPIILVMPGESFGDLGRQTYKVNPQNKDDFNRLFESLIEKQCPIVNICFAWPLGHDKSVKESLERGVSSFLFVCQSLIKQKLESKVHLLYLYATKRGEAQPHNEAVRGFVNTLHLEHPKLLCKTVEVRHNTFGHEQILNAVAAEFRAHVLDATAVRYEGEERYIKRLKAFDLEEAVGSPPSPSVGIKEKGVYLITGGAGGLGLIFAEFLAKECRARLVLTGRSHLSVEREARLGELRKLGAEVVYLPADVSDHEDVKNLVHQTRSRFGEINGIIHAAGILRDSLIRNKTAEEMSAVFAPKVYGTLHLDEVTKNEKLDFFVTFSSLAAIAGNAGQCDYSFANHFMDSFAAERELLRAKGERSGKTLSINWSLWADGGMKLDEQTELYFKRTLGIKALSVATGLEAFVKGLVSGKSQFAVLEGVQEKVELAWGVRKRTPAPAAPAGPSSSSQTVNSPVSDETGGDLLVWLQNELSQIVMEFLKLDAGDMAVDKILLDLGFDSIGLTTFANVINEKYQLDITPVLFFDYPSIGEIAKYLSSERRTELLRFYPGSATSVTTTVVVPPAAMQQPPRSEDGETHQKAPFKMSKGWDPVALDRQAVLPASGGGFSLERRFVDMPVAIVGMSGVMPQSDDLEEFWENLKNSKDMITVIPPDRWRWQDYYGDPLKEINKSNSKWGGFMNEIDKFDPLFFGISPREAQTMDPQQRIFLEQVWKAIEDSGHKVSDLSGTRTGLFVGVATNDYIQMMNSRQIVVDGYTASGNSHSVLANRVSYLLNLRGPSAPIDTACSSSLIALHRAIESIHTGSCDMAIVGGVQVMLSPAAYISFSMAGMLSGDGKCKTFDKGANGYVRGEGCGAIVLKRLSVAEADGNHIYAVIKATAENHGGRVTTMTAPNSSAQSALLIEAYEKAQVDPTTVGYIECHGTGTSLGDPIEIQALSKAFSELYKRSNKPPAKIPHCGLSSVKTNIGHLETAAGIASVLKVLLAIKHRQIPANIHFAEINPYINLKETPFYIADRLTPWQVANSEDGSPLPRRAGVSSFGFGGANAHIVLEEYISPKPSAARARGPQLIVLSAKNENRLNAYVQSMHAYLEKENVDLVDFAYTLQVGRDEMLERLAVVVSSTADLKQKLNELLHGGERPKDSYRNNIRSKEAKSQTADGSGGDTLVQALIKQKDLSRLAELWVCGAKIDWRLLYNSDVPKRISVPTYPFARERYWIPSAEGKMSEEPRGPDRIHAAFLHPLIHRNVSTMGKQKFTSRFSGEEFFLTDYVVETRKLLPGVAYLEMARAAGELSGNAQVRVVRNVTWERPIAVGTDGQEVELCLTPSENGIKFSVNTVGNENLMVHATGELAYSFDTSAPEALDIAGIQSRCPEQVMSGSDLYSLLRSSGLKYGSSFQIVQRICANKSESLAILQMPEHLRKEADQFWLHPALLDGSAQTIFGLVKKNGMSLPLCTPYSVGEVQIFHPLHDLYYGYAIWAADNSQNKQNNLKVDLHLLDKSGKCLVRIKDFVFAPFHRVATEVTSPEADQPENATGQEHDQAQLQSLVPIWAPVRFETDKAIVLPESTKILLLGGDQAQLDWVQKCYPRSQLLQLASTANIETVAKKLGDCSFDQLLWAAPDLASDGGEEYGDDALIVGQQEAGVLAVFRSLKALLHLGYANKKLQWTIVTSRTEAVIENQSIQPTHAGITGLVGSLAKEYPQWDLRLLDVDFLGSVSAQQCLSLPWDRQGNVLAHRRGEWFERRLAPTTGLDQATPVYRQNGVYVVIGGAGGLGEVWTRFMMEYYRANVVWIGRRRDDAGIDSKIHSLTLPGHAPPLYIAADATNFDALEQAWRTIRKTYPVIHGVVHSAVNSTIVLQDASIARMEESGFRASLSAKVDISVNMDRVFGKQELDFMLFFSSVISFFKSPGQSNYSAGCTFQDSFARELQQQHAYPVKIINWGYWGEVGFAADEFHRKIMEQMGIGSIEASEGMASLQTLVNSKVPQMVLIKTLDSRATAGLTRSDARRTETKAGDIVATKTNQTANDSPAPALSGRLGNAYIQKIITENLSVALRMDAAMIRDDVPLPEYGVDSIIGVNLVRAINETLGIDLPMKALFESISVAQLAELIAELVGNADKNDNAPIRPVNRAQFERLPLSYAQERVWFFEQLEPGSARYNVPVAVTLSGELEISQLEQAFNLIIARHENLRTLFPSHEGQAQQLILERLDFKFDRVDLSHGASREERDREAKAICQSEAATPFDLAQGPLLRGKVIRLSRHEHIVMLNMHHIISDGWSLGVLIKELDLIMEAFRQGRRPELGALPIQYVDYTVWQRKWLEEGGVLKQQLAY